MAITVQKMKKEDISILFDIALRAFEPDYEKYGVYPPLMKMKNKSFLPPRIFGKTIFFGKTIIGGIFAVGIGKKGEIGAVFIDPSYQHNGYGRKAILMVEKMYPRVRQWKVETLADNLELHKFYESLGYVKSGEIKDKKSDLRGIVYKKTV